MKPPVPYFRSAGSGPAVVCLHANAGSSGQWRALMDSLAPRFHVLAVDSYGAGRSPAWPLGVPVLYMFGKDSPAPARGVARVLTPALPRVQVVEFEGMGHMGPLTHPELVNGVISGFLERHRPFHRADVLQLAAQGSLR